MFAMTPDPETHSSRIYKASPSSLGDAMWSEQLLSLDHPGLRKPDFICEPGYLCARKAATSREIHAMKKNNAKGHNTQNR